jgi:hypothetical protein
VSSPQRRLPAVARLGGPARSAVDEAAVLDAQPTRPVCRPRTHQLAARRGARKRAHRAPPHTPQSLPGRKCSCTASSCPHQQAVGPETAASALAPAGPAGSGSATTPSRTGAALSGAITATISTADAIPATTRPAAIPAVLPMTVRPPLALRSATASPFPPAGSPRRLPPG